MTDSVAPSVFCVHLLLSLNHSIQSKQILTPLMQNLQSWRAHVLDNDGYHLAFRRGFRQTCLSLIVLHPSFYEANPLISLGGLHCPLHLSQHELRHVRLHRQNTFALWLFLPLASCILICTTLSIMAIFCLFRSFFAKSSSRLWGSCVARIVVNVIKKEAAAIGVGSSKWAPLLSGRFVNEQPTTEIKKITFSRNAVCLISFARPVKQTWDVL